MSFTLRNLLGCVYFTGHQIAQFRWCRTFKNFWFQIAYTALLLLSSFALTCIVALVLIPYHWQLKAPAGYPGCWEMPLLPEFQRTESVYFSKASWVICDHMILVVRHILTENKCWKSPPKLWCSLHDKERSDFSCSYQCNDKKLDIGGKAILSQYFVFGILNIKVFIYWRLNWTDANNIVYQKQSKE